MPSNPDVGKLRHGFLTGIAYCIRVLEASASVIEVDTVGPTARKNSDGTETIFEAVVSSGRVNTAARLRELANTFRNDAQLAAEVSFPDWKNLEPSLTVQETKEPNHDETEPSQDA